MNLKQRINEMIESEQFVRWNDDSEPVIGDSEPLFNNTEQQMLL